MKIVRKIEQDLYQTALDSSQKNKYTTCVIFDDDESENNAQRKSENNKRSDYPSGKSSLFIPFMPKLLFNA